MEVGVKAMYDKAASGTETASNQLTTVTDIADFWKLLSWIRVIASHSRQNESEIPGYGSMVAEIHKAMENLVVHAPPYRESGPATLTDRETMVFLGFPAWPQGIASRPRRNEGEVRENDIADAPSGMDRSLLKEEIRSLLGKASKEGWGGSGRS